VSYPGYALYRCQTCRRLYCKNCFIYDAEGKVICLRCAKRRIAPGGPRSKYVHLTAYLAKRGKYTDHVTVSFSKIEEILGGQLPTLAYYNRQWWSNTRSHAASEAWVLAGWNVHNVDLEGKIVTFLKERHETAEKAGKRQRRKSVTAAFKAMALRRRPIRPKEPSRTKVAKVQARAKNITRKRAAAKAGRGRTRLRGAYQKRLYSPDEKPS